ncbi:co-chaperone GroES [Thalassobaculum salexigens]|uniref:co-chaperone GroES n=1 Tax=Thalassobaculum salexigens TaxID=455360 RepID=UPI000429343B|nr:co-chaperone GroES [Thalassobaculum salexigens]
MKLRPLQDRVLIRPLERDTISSGGIIIPDTAKEKPVEGTVVAVGSGNRDDQGKLHTPDVTVGDRVLYGKWSGSEVKLDGEDLVIMKETDILGIVDQATATTPAA